MKLIFYKLKKIVVYFIRIILRLLGFNILSASESIGNFYFLTLFKFTKKNIVRLPYRLGRSIRGSLFINPAFSSVDPFQEALKLNGKNLDEVHFYTILSTHLNFEKGKLICDYPNGIQNISIKRFPAYCYAYPWESYTVYQKSITYKDDVIENRNNYYNNLSDDIYDITHIKSHYIQFQNLLSSVLINGYIPTDNPPKVYILLSGNEWRWIMSGDGNHRAYICNLLKYDYIDVCIQGVFTKKKLYLLSNENGHNYTFDEISDLFDKIWSGNECLRGLV